VSQAQYDIYRQSVISLTRSLVVKSSIAAEAINRELSAIRVEVQPNSPETWLYYLHLAGRYHSTDVPMTVKSLDTMEEIPFTVQSMQEHLATAREYRTFGRYFRTLVERYPEQEDLIRGILTPVDIQKAIEAEDGTILYYDRSLVESNEENLIPRLEWWTKVFCRRWMVRAYASVDPLYTAAHMAMMYMHIPSVIMNIRMTNCHTNYAHSYHIREYLASHQGLDWSIPYLTKKQMLWLYREIRRIERNAGKQTTFFDLVQNILTERSLPLDAWDMRHNLKEMPNEISPLVEFIPQAVNHRPGIVTNVTRNVYEMLEAEVPMARSNARVMDDEAPEIRRELENSKHDQLETKILESSVVDYSEASVFTLTDMLLNHWFYFAFNGTYRAVTVIDSPKTGESIVLTPQEAAVTFLYALGRTVGFEMVNIPKLPVLNVRKMRMPTRSKIAGMIDNKVRDEHVVDELFAAVNPIFPIISTEAFYDGVSDILSGILRQRWLWATRENHMERGQTEAAAMHFYQDVLVDFGHGQTFSQWFTSRNLDIETYNDLELALLAEELFMETTGSKLRRTMSLRDIQGAMLRIMRQLSSYTVQYLQSINTTPLVVIDWLVPRIGNMDISGQDHIPVQIHTIDVNAIKASGLDKVAVDHLLFGENSDFHVRGRDNIRIEMPSTETMSSITRYFHRVELPEFDATVMIPPSELTDVVDRSSDSYTGGSSLPLDDAFQTLVSPHYVLTSDEVQDNWDNRPDQGRLQLYADGLPYPSPWPSEVTVDHLVMPGPTRYEVVLDELTYPTFILETTINHLNYPVRDLSAITIDHLDYPARIYRVTLDQLNYPDSFNVSIDHLDYPKWEVELDNLTYPQTGELNLDQLNYPMQTP